MAIATFKVDAEFNIGEHFQLFGHGIVLERTDRYGNGIHTTDISLIDLERLGGVEGILAIYIHVFHVVHVRLLAFRLDAEGRGDVDVMNGFSLHIDYVECSFGTLWDGHHSAFHREIRMTSGVG